MSPTIIIELSLFLLSKMEVRVLIVLVACLSCLIPPALGKGLVAKAVAKGAIVKGAAIGVGLAAKGGLALVAKKALLGILLKGAALKGAALLGKKKLAIKGAGALAMAGLGGTLAADVRESSLTDSSEADGQTTTTASPLRDIISGASGVVRSILRLREAVAQKRRAVSRIMSAVPRIIGPLVE